MVEIAKDNREKFLNHIASRLNYERNSLENPNMTFINDLPHETLENHSIDELLKIAKKQSESLHTEFKITSKNDLANLIDDLIYQYGSGNLIMSDDRRFEEFHLTQLHQYPVVYRWQGGEKNREANLQAAQNANIGIVFGEYLLAESGSILVESSSGHGRSLNFLPKNYIAIIPKSKIVPRITQATDDYTQRIRNGEKIGSSLTFISGPSNSGDIEMILVVGVHGPMNVAYVIVEDC